MEIEGAVEINEIDLDHKEHRVAIPLAINQIDAFMNARLDTQNINISSQMWRRFNLENLVCGYLRCVPNLSS
jgi:hypothetical protein